MKNKISRRKRSKISSWLWHRQKFLHKTHKTLNCIKKNTDKLDCEIKNCISKDIIYRSKTTAVVWGRHLYYRYLTKDLEAGYVKNNGKSIRKRQYENAFYLDREHSNGQEHGNVPNCPGHKNMPPELNRIYLSKVWFLLPLGTFSSNLMSFLTCLLVHMASQPAVTGGSHVSKHTGKESCIYLLLASRVQSFPNPVCWLEAQGLQCIYLCFICGLLGF